MLTAPPIVLGRAFFERHAIDVVRELVGAELLVKEVGGLIVETEAYLRDDAASHSFAGQTPRNASMFSGTGRAYVYRSHGLHWCLNTVFGPEPGCAVLIRAIEPRFGVSLMEARRGTANRRLLCAGPGRLCQALSINDSFDGLALDALPFVFRAAPSSGDAAICTTRVGISKAVERPWRFSMAGSTFLSRQLRPPAHGKAVDDSAF
jgi:DNA-3-methyladenine glycosylase